MLLSTRLKLSILLICILAAVPLYLTLIFHPRQRLERKLVGLPPVSVSTINTRSDEARREPAVPILLWWDSVYDTVDEVKTCGRHKCRISNNRSLKTHPNTKAFIFYGSHFKPYSLPLPRRKDHIWALIHEESPRNAFILSHENTLNIFNFTSTYNQKSDYPITTQWLKCSDWIYDKKYLLPLVDKNRLRGAGLAPILYIHSDCDVPSDRDTYVETLQRYIAVDSYGSCKNNRKLPKRLRFRDDMSPLQDSHFYQFVARYKFTLAFENYVCEDYITEKFWRPIRTGSIPIVFGAPNIREFLPSNKSAIIVDEFDDVEDLANYIHLLDTNDRMYLEYLNYKDEPIRNVRLLNELTQRDWAPSFCSKYTTKRHGLAQHTAGRNGLTLHTPRTLLPTAKRKFDSIFYGYECFLCNAIPQMSTGTSKVALPDHYRCPSPRQFDDSGRYSIHDKAWSADWLRGKYEANVMEKMYNNNSVCSLSEFLKLVDNEFKKDL